MGSRSGRVAAGAAAAIGSTVLFADGAAADNFSVTNTADAGSGSLRDAINQANASTGDPDVITFDSTVTGTITLTSGQLSILSGGPLEIRGPGAGKLSVSGNNSSRVFYAYAGASPGKPILISGLTITGGRANIGAGVVNFDNAVTIRDSVVSGNAASSDGGGLWSDGFDSTLIVENTEVSGNTAGADGGGIYVEDTDNNGSPALRFSDSEITGNTASDDGGGAYFYDPDGQVLFERTTVSGNTATDHGGGLFIDDTDSGASVGVDASTFSRNTAREGGGIYLYGPDNPVTVENVTIADNEVTSGTTGGLFAYKPYAGFSVEATTIAGNEGLGINLHQRSITVNNSIVADSAGADLGGGGTFNADFSLIENPGSVTVNETTAGSNKLGVDPKLGPLADNGGPTETKRPDFSSPAIDAANTALTADQRGLTRPEDLTSVPAGIGNQSDMGSVELQESVNTSPPTVSGGSTVGQTLTADPGQWTGDPTFSYQFLRCDANGDSCVPIPGATQRTYTLTADDVGSTIRVDVTATGEGGPSDAVRSAATAVVAAVASGVKDPLLELASPQVQKGGTIRLRLLAGAGENVRVRVGGKIFVGKGNAVQMESEAITSGQPLTLVLKPKKKGGNRRILKALKNGRDVEARINASLTNDAGEVFSKQLTASLKRT